MELKRIFREDVRIESKNLIFRPVCEEDAEGLLAMYGDERIYRYRPGLPRKSLLLVNKVICRFEQSSEKGEAVAYTILDKRQNNAVVGLVEVYNPDPRVEQIEIGYTVTPDYWGKGIATEAIGAVTDYLILDIGVNRVRAAVHVENEASCRALLKNGFTKEGMERQGEFWQGIGFVDIYRFAKLKMDYE